MDRNFWIGRWQRGEIGWHQDDVEPNLMKHFAGLKPTRVFVPLCGKSLDLHWLAKQGHEVVGVELSEQAVQEFFAEAGLKPSVRKVRSLMLYEADKIRIYQGDFFELSREDVWPLGAIYDRAALIALPREMRPRYAEHLIKLLGDSPRKPDFRFLQLVLDRTPADDKGPPFSIPEAEVREHYEKFFEITPQSRELERKDPDRIVEECVYTLKARG